jgi:hypothetical protein
MSIQERLNRLDKIEMEIYRSLTPYLQLYQAIKNNNLLRAEDVIARKHSIEAIARRWNMSLDLATESFDLAHQSANEKKENKWTRQSNKF